MKRRANAEKGERAAWEVHRIRMASISGVLGCPRKGPEVDDVEGFFLRCSGDYLSNSTEQGL